MVPLLVGGTALAQYDDCKLTCARDRDTRNLNCPSPLDSSSPQEREQCMKDSRDAYNDCIKSCPADTSQPAPPPSAPPPPPAPPMGNPPSGY